ncbi:MAG TPA: nitrogen fixation protein FixH [Albitalea sp.]|uniref:nitrogen fixation protein FixH n=1 Tax=Piscinibacter sp. TaxID=1903157 RepID=UPI002ED2E317
MNHDMPRLPWWRVRAVWLVIAGPALVVAASLATLVLALRGGDVPLRVNQAAGADTMAPATQARNHASASRH